MISIIKTIAAVFIFSLSVFSQQAAREQIVQNIDDLKSQIDGIKLKISGLEKGILQPSAKDIALAQEQGVNVIRLLPREKYDGLLAIRGGGAYYSFVLKSQEYGRGSDIELSQGNLGVGFAGADYGFLRDLGDSTLEDINKDTVEVNAIIKYVPPTDEPTVRAEYQKLWKGYEVNGVSFMSRLPAVVGHTFILRSVEIDRSDILVAFNVLRKDGDGSLILLWKPIESFSKPEMQREKTAAVQ